MQKSNKELVRKASQIWTSRDLSQLSTIYDEHCVQHQQRHHEEVTFTGIEIWHKYIEGFLKEYPHYKEKIIFQVAEEDKVVSMLDCRAPSCSWSGVVVDRIDNNKIKETWAWFKRNK